MSEQDEKRQDEAPADEAPAAGRRVPLATVVIATLLSLAIAGLVAGLLLGVGEKKDDPNIVTLDNDVASVPSLGEGEDTVGRPAPTSDYTIFDGEEASVADYAGTDPANVPFTSTTGPGVIVPVDAPDSLVTAVLVPTDAGPYLVEIRSTPDGLRVARATPQDRR